MNLNWTEPRCAKEGISSYNHVIAESPLGNIMIEWKSWKDTSSYDVTIRNNEEYIGMDYDLDSAKKIAIEYLDNKAKELNKLNDGKTIAERVHISQAIHSGLMDEIDDVILEAYEKYEPEIYEKLDFDTSTDYYDNSLEVYFDISLPYPYEPCKEIRDAVYNLGFSGVYWNFRKDVFMPEGNEKPPLEILSYDEIVGWWPRHTRNVKYLKSTEYGYVDERFNEKEWKENYNYKQINQG